MKAISWNVNGLRACLGKNVFLPFLNAEDPDFLAVQETKMQEDQLNLHFDNYYRFMNSAEKKGYAGTMILAKEKPLNVHYDLPFKDHPKEGRVIALEYPTFYFICAYVPNAQDGLRRIDYRMKWEDDLKAYLSDLNKTKPVIYTGDLNVANEPIDLANPEDNHLSPGFSDQERGKFKALLAAGFVDTFRYQHPQEVRYSWWSYRTRSRERNVGWRIDYFLVSEALKDKIITSTIYDDIYGSDHCPVGVVLDL